MIRPGAPFDAAHVRRCAQVEVDKELFLVRVEAEKARIRARMAMPWWRRLFPYTITKRKDT